MANLIAAPYKKRISTAIVTASFGLVVGLLALSTASSYAAGPTWTSGLESGDLSEWKANNGGDVNVNTGNGSGSVSTTVAHSGKYSLKMSINSAGSTNAVRFFRWNSQTGYFSAWYYFPQNYSGMGWWNVFQWKDYNNNPSFVVNVENPSGNAMKFWLYNAYTGATYNQSVATIPVGQWVHLEAYYQIASDKSGRVTIYQNGQQIIDVNGVQTKASSASGIYWGVSNYTDKINPSAATIYVDDCAISSTRIGPGSQPLAAQSFAQPNAPSSEPAAASNGAPAFQLGFGTLAGLLGEMVGSPVENEHYGANGDSLQQTTKGLMVWRKADNWTAFTNGWWTWVNGPFGIQDRGNETRFDWEAQ